MPFLSSHLMSDPYLCTHSWKLGQGAQKEADSALGPAHKGRSGACLAPRCSRRAERRATEAIRRGRWIRFHMTVYMHAHTVKGTAIRRTRHGQIPLLQVYTSEDVFWNGVEQVQPYVHE